LSDIKKIVITAMLISLGIVLPLVFHAIPQGLGGRVLLPMHIPIFLAGLIVGPFFGFFAGLITPILSSMSTGMPAAGAITYRMMVELATYGIVAGLAVKFIRTRSTLVDLYIALILAMVFGRIMAGIAQAFIFSGGGAFGLSIWISGYFVTSLPGILLQLILIPAIILALKRAKVM
jgi:niacin transporter